MPINIKAKKPATVREIAQGGRLATDYVERPLNTLKKTDVVKSIRGTKGGYILSAPPEKISVYSAVKAIEKDVLELLCFRKKRKKAKMCPFVRL